MFFYNRVPIGLYTLVILTIIPYVIYMYNTKTKKEYPNHPIKYMLATGCVYGVVSCFYRLAKEVDLGVIWTKIINILNVITGVSFVLSFIYMYYLLIKLNYITPETLAKLKRNLAPLLIIFVVIVVVFIVMRYSTGDSAG